MLPQGSMPSSAANQNGLFFFLFHPTPEKNDGGKKKGLEDTTRRSRVTNIARPEVLKADTKLKHSLILCILGIESTKPFLHIRPLVLPKVWTVIPRMDGLQLVDGFVVVLVVVFGSNYGCLEMWTSVASLVGSFSSPSYFLFVLIAILYISCFVSWG